MRHVNAAVIPANAGIHSAGAQALGGHQRALKQWIPAFAGMTGFTLRPAEERRQAGDHLTSSMQGELFTQDSLQRGIEGTPPWQELDDVPQQLRRVTAIRR